MNKKVSDYVTFPIVAFVIGFFIHTTVMVWLVVFALILAFVRESAVVVRYRLLLQIILWSVCALGSSVAMFLYFTTRPDLVLPTPPPQQTPVQNSTIRESVQLHSVRFIPPQGYEVRIINDNSVRLLSPEKIPFGSELTSEKIYHITKNTTAVTDFETFATSYARQLHATAASFGLTAPLTPRQLGTTTEWFLPPYTTGPHYQLRTSEINTIPVLIEQANFGALCGNTYTAQFWIGDGTLVSLSIDCYAEYPNRPDTAIISELVNSFELIN